MAEQNIYDNNVFFEGYKKIRDNDGNANELFEKPALFSLMPNLKGKAVLDLGCGFGEHCMHYIEEGAEKVIGIDISEKMLDVARKENSNPNIIYINMSMEHIAEIKEMFDVVVSSLAMHYVEDFASVVKDVYEMLNDDGIFVFSQENPLCTTHSDGQRWTRDENGKKLYVNLANYGIEGKRETEWFVDNVQKYHRTFSNIVNTLTGAGFIVEKMIEPLPTEEILEKYPEYIDLFHKPDFLVIRCRK